MNTKPIEDFKKLLVEKGYKGHFIENHERKKINGHLFYCVNITNEDEKIIQVFVLMRDWFRERRKSYPIWKTYPQRVGTDGSEVKPAVFIVTQTDNGKWDVYSASDTSIKKDLDVIINYDLACDRFDLRLDARNKMGKMLRTVKWICWVLASIMALYLILHVVTNTSDGCVLPLTNEMVLLSGLIVCLVIVPIVLPFTKAVSVKGLVDIIVRE